MVSENENLVGGFELKNCIATGSSTQIWEVTQQGANIPLAMKMLLPDAHKESTEKANLRHEFKVGSSLEHPSFLRFHKLEINRDHGFFVMDYFRAPSLKTQIAGNLPEVQSRFKKIAEALCQAYAHMHEKGWLHRDIKPENILVNKTGEVRVIDFSLSSRISGALGKILSGKQTIKGTRTYIAPETILKKSPTIQTDIYSLGVSLFELATGSPPFAGLSPNDLLKKHLSEAPAAPSAENPNVAPELDQVLLRMLAKKPKDRPADMREAMTAFRSVRCFVEDPAELYERRIREAKEKEAMSIDRRLDSRADADRVARGLPSPTKQVSKSKPRTASMERAVEEKKSPGRTATGGPPQHAPMPGGMPQMPWGMGQMPGMMPGMMPGAMPQMPQMPIMMPHMPQMPLPPGHMMPPQQAPGHQPQQPPGHQPQQAPGHQPPPHPGQQPVPQPGPPAGQQPASQPAQPNQPEATQPHRLPLERPAPPPMPENPEADDDLDYMTELPDVS